MKIVVGHFVPNLFSLFGVVTGVTIYPFIFVRFAKNEILIRHESIHIEQQRETLIIGFFLIYLFDYLRGLIKYRNHYTAYWRIRFEQEAYRYQRDSNYLNRRQPGNWRLFNV